MSNCGHTQKDTKSIITRQNQATYTYTTNKICIGTVKELNYARKLHSIKLRTNRLT